MFDNLSAKLETAFKTLKGQGRITDVNVASTVKEIRKVLIDADVNFKVAKGVTENILKEALGQKVLISVKPGELLTKIVYDELTKLMGSAKADMNLRGDPAVILMSGLQGSGKTTFSYKASDFSCQKYCSTDESCPCGALKETERQKGLFFGAFEIKSCAC